MEDSFLSNFMFLAVIAALYVKMSVGQSVCQCNPQSSWLKVQSGYHYTVLIIVTSSTPSRMGDGQMDRRTDEPTDDLNYICLLSSISQCGFNPIILTVIQQKKF